MKTVWLFLLMLSISGAGHALKGRAYILDETKSQWVELSREAQMDMLMSKLPPAGDLSSIGQVLWPLIQENEITFDPAKHFIHALPLGVASPSSLSGWKAGRASPVKILFENPLKEDVIVLDLILTFDYAGKYQGKGNYLANVRLLPANVSVMSLYRLTCIVDVAAPVNRGSAQNPLWAVRLFALLKGRDALLGGQDIQSFTFDVDGLGKWSVN